jgi:hypothetical protein
MGEEEISRYFFLGEPLSADIPSPSNGIFVFSNNIVNYMYRLKNRCRIITVIGVR